MEVALWGLLPIGIMFVLFSLFFFIKKEKSVFLIAGFNTLSEEEQAQYDTERLARDTAKLLLVGGLISLVGAIPTFFIGNWVAIIVFGVWLIWMLHDFHWTIEKGYSKYKRK